MSYVKFWTQLAATVLAALIPALAVGPLDAAGWVNVVILAAGAVTVANAGNIPGWRYAKLIAAVVSAVAVVVAAALTDGGISTAEIVQMIVAGLGAAGVGALPNGPREPHVVDHA